MLRHLDLFSGIGGFALAAQMTGGIETQQFCEIDSYAQRVLKKNFSGIPIHGDITTLFVDPGQYDLITGGFPCQDISSANPNGRGLEGERSGLFYELMRLVCQCRPRYVVLENVAALLSKRKGRDMGAVLWELSECGYDAEWQVISAASVGAPHLRKRVFIVAYLPSIKWGNGRDNWQKGYVQNTSIGTTQEGQPERNRREYWTRTLGEVDANACSKRLEARQCQPSIQKKIRTIKGCGATPNSAELHERPGDATTIKGQKQQPRKGDRPTRVDWSSEPGVLRVVDGVSNRVERIKGLGNAVVPQVAAIAIQRVLELEDSRLKTDAIDHS